jgi:hypothetical protein
MFEMESEYAQKELFSGQMTEVAVGLGKLFSQQNLANETRQYGRAFISGFTA